MEKLASTTKSIGGDPQDYETAGGGTCWTRTWNGNFTTPTGKSYNTLNIVETAIVPGREDLVCPEIAKVTRMLRREQKQSALTISVMRDSGQASTMWPHEHWVTAGVRSNMVKPISFEDVFSILNKAEFDNPAGRLVSSGLIF